MWWLTLNTACTPQHVLNEVLVTIANEGVTNATLRIKKYNTSRNKQEVRRILKNDN